MAATLYMTPSSASVRSVQITAKALGIQLKEKHIDLPKGEHLQPEYQKINPQGTIPSLVDNDGFTICEAHAINAYLVSKYAKNDSLYPKNLKTRATVDQRLFFDSSIAAPTGVRIIRPILFGEKNSLDDKEIENVSQVYAFLERFLDGTAWVAGDSLTIADYNLYATISASNVLLPIDGRKYPQVASWFGKVGALPEVQAGKKGLEIFESMIKSKMQ